jgi:hypothetical protein
MLMFSACFFNRIYKVSEGSFEIQNMMFEIRNSGSCLTNGVKAI